LIRRVSPSATWQIAQMDDPWQAEFRFTGE
jgi:hypothetical protein